MEYVDVVFQFDFEIVYCPGRQNIVADVLLKKVEDLRITKVIKEADRTKAIFRLMGISIIPLVAIFVSTFDESVAYIFNLSVHVIITERKYGFETIEQILHQNLINDSLSLLKKKASDSNDT
jgi:hypothetical protein